MPIHTAPGRRSRYLQPLPVIIEDAAEPPTIPEKSPRRLTLHGHGSTPSYLDSVLLCTGSDRKPEGTREGFRDHSWIVKRGGWYRLILAAVSLVGLIIGLTVGLTIGLSQRTQSDSPAPAPLPTSLFPAGSYAFNTALTNVSTGCTAIPFTWRCFPYSLYDPGTPSLSASTYFWVIGPINRFSFGISSSDNPFAPSFSNVTLTLLDGNQDTERFIFSFAMEKTVTATGPLNDNNEAATCRYPDTVMRATVWTRMRANYPVNISGVAAPVKASNVFDTWPFAVQVVQQSKRAPECRNVKGEEVGGDLRPKNSTECRCEYKNFDLP